MLLTKRCTTWVARWIFAPMRPSRYPSMKTLLSHHKKNTNGSTPTSSASTIECMHYPSSCSNTWPSASTKTDSSSTNGSRMTLCQPIGQFIFYLELQALSIAVIWAKITLSWRRRSTVTQVSLQSCQLSAIQGFKFRSMVSSSRSDPSTTS